MLSRSVHKYLQHYAEPEAELLPASPIIAQHYEYALVIPVCDEPADFFQPLIASVEIEQPLMVIVVVNCPASDPSDRHFPDAAARAAQQLQAQVNTEALWNYLVARTEVRWEADDGAMFLGRYCGNPHIDLLLINRFSGTRCIPRRQGVGLARKIGNDVALALMAREIIRRPWLYNTDADVRLPAGYFAATPDPATCAGLYPFEHRAATPELELATNLYELSLHYYVRGLKWAGSRYGMHTIGSIITINAQHYAEVRGFPKRCAAEDFYLLNKLSKVGRIMDVVSTPVRISGRASLRVPFGTGPALKRISELERPLEQFTFYDPRTFTELRHLLDALPSLWHERDIIAADGLQQPLAEALTTAGTPKLLLNSVLAALESFGIAAAVQHALKHSRQQQTFVQHIDTWFDALRTLQFIHYLRDAALPSKPYRDSVCVCEFMRGSEATTDILWPQVQALCKKMEAAAVM